MEQMSNKYVEYVRNLRVIVQSDSRWYYVHQKDLSADLQSQRRTKTIEEALSNLFGAKADKVVAGKDYVLLDYLNNYDGYRVLYVDEPTDGHLDIYLNELSGKGLLNDTFGFSRSDRIINEEHSTSYGKMVGWRIFKDGRCLPLYIGATGLNLYTKIKGPNESKAVQNTCQLSSLTDKLTENDDCRNVWPSMSTAMGYDIGGQDITCGFIKNRWFYVSAKEGQLSEDTNRKLKLFLDNTDRFNYFLSHRYLEKLSHDENSPFLFKTVNDLANFLSAKLNLRTIPSSFAAKERMDAAMSTAQQIDWDSCCRSPLFDRQGNDIIMARRSSGPDYLLIYNLKEQKRRVYVFPNREHTTQPETPIPSMHYIEMHFQSQEEYRYQEYDYSAGRTIYAPNAEYRPPVWKKTIEEFIKGTNLELLMKFFNGKLFYATETNGYRRFDFLGDKQFDINSLICETRFAMPMYKFLIDPKPWTEQLIKSGLYYLYTACIDNADQIKTPGTKWGPWRAYSLAINKGTNLKKTFGMTLEQLRLLDKNISIRLESNCKAETNYYRKSLLPEFRVPEIASALGAEVNTLDINLFKAILTRTNDESPLINWLEFEANHTFSQLTEHMSAKERWNFISKWSGYGTMYNDYLRMKMQMQTMASVKPDKIHYDEKEYPVFFTNTKKFVRFTAQTDWRGDIISHKRQWEELHRTYSMAATLIADDFDEYYGAQLTLTAPQTLRFLHDDLAYWIRFYQDETKDALFGKAVERIKPLEYEGKELSIVAPKTIKDLQKEGSVLGHCVAGFVDPIIQNTTNVVFIRRNDHINDPFYTVEILNDGSIRQVHCYRNGDTTNDTQQRVFEELLDKGDKEEAAVYDKQFNIDAFLLDWAKHKTGKVKVNTIKVAYGALCANRQ